MNREVGDPSRFFAVALADVDDDENRPEPAHDLQAADELEVVPGDEPARIQQAGDKEEIGNPLKYELYERENISPEQTRSPSSGAGKLTERSPLGMN
jgi:hypothetical protein